MEEYVLIGLILAILPIISWLLQFHLSRKKKELPLFKKHPPTYLLDWLFVPFNFFWIYTIIFNLNAFILLGVVSLLINYVSAKYYIKQHIKEKRPCHLFNIKNSKSSAAGYVHAIFSVIQSFLILTFLFSGIMNVFVYINSIALFLFLLPILYSSKKIHGKISGPDRAIFVAGIIILILRLIL
ncbi:MAG: hypothetical protein ABIE36_01890 [Candidatus Diapherotrites archaeon]